MVFTIAPTAARLATYRSPTTVSADTQKIVMQVDADKRLIEAAGGAARYMADAAGLASGAATELQAAVLAVCDREIGQLAGANQRLEIRVSRSSGAIEVAVVLAAAIGHAESEPPAAIKGVDRIHYEKQSGKTITRLTKFLSEAASGD
jgi:hypothetical protein